MHPVHARPHGSLPRDREQHQARTSGQGDVGYRHVCSETAYKRSRAKRVSCEGFGSPAVSLNVAWMVSELKTHLSIRKRRTYWDVNDDDWGEEKNQ